MVQLNKKGSDYGIGYRGVTGSLSKKGNDYSIVPYRIPSDSGREHDSKNTDRREFLKIARHILFPTR